MLDTTAEKELIPLHLLLTTLEMAVSILPGHRK